MIIESAIVAITALIAWRLLSREDNNSLIENLREFDKRDIMDKKQKSSVRRKVDIELGITPPKSSVHKNKKKYTRKTKHKK